MRRHSLLLLAASLLLGVVLSQINHYLADWQMSVWCGGLFVACLGLRLPYRTGAVVAFVAGLLLDANAPVAFGTQGILLLAGHALVFTLRARAPRDDTLVGVMIALITNLALFLALGFARIGNSPLPAETWMRSFADLLLSQLLIALIGPWYFAVQKRLLQLGGADLRELTRRAL